MSKEEEAISLIPPEFDVPYEEFGKSKDGVIRIDDGYMWDAIEKIHEKYAKKTEDR